MMSSQPSPQLDIPSALSNLTPFIGPLKTDLHAAIRQFWKFPKEIKLVIRDDEDNTPSIPIVCTHSNRSVRWELQISASQAPTPSFVLRHKSGPPGLYRLLARNVKTGVSRQAKQRLQQAWQNFYPFRGMRDQQFREVHSDHEHLNGRIRLGYRCNQDCWFCWQNRKWPSPPISYYERWVDELTSMGIRTLNITGGEPTTYKELPMLMKRASQNGVRISIQSNAIRLQKPAYLRQLLDAGLSLVMVSYHSADSALSDKMTKAPGTHQKTQLGISQLKQMNVPFTLNCVVEQANFQFLEQLAEDIVQRFQSNALQRVSFSQPVDYFQGGWDQKVVSLEHVQPHLIKACQILYEAQIAFQIGGSCGFPLCLLADQPQLLKNQHQIGLTYHKSEVSHRDYSEECNACKVNCQGLRKIYLNKYGSHFLQPIADIV